MKSEMHMELIPIKETFEENKEFTNDPDANQTLDMSIAYFRKIGFNPPWIGYYVKKGDHLVGSAAFKGQPVNKKVEIAYGTFERFRQQGIGTDICRLLVELSLQTDPSVEITARTFAQRNYSARILEKNGFELLGTVIDEDDGEVWEWRYIK